MRPSRDEVLIASALLWSTRGTCDRAKVGAVIARDGRILVSGYNGPPAGMPHCNHGTDPGPCEDAVHAEANAIVYAARYGTRLEGTDIYCTHFPCPNCAKLIVNSGIQRVFYLTPYRDMWGKWLFEQVNIPVTKMLPPSFQVDMMGT